MPKHIHVHIHTNDAATAHDPSNGQFTTSGAAGGNAMHHHKQAKFHQAERDRKGDHHEDHPHHASAMVEHGRARNAIEYAQGAGSKEAASQHMAAAQMAANGAAHHEAKISKKKAAGGAAKSEAKINANAAPGGATVASGPLKKGESVKIHPDHLESHEDPDDEYEVVGAGESPHGAVEIRSKKGLRAINQVHATSLMRHTPK